MKESEYLRRVEIEKNPYEGYIETVEPLFLGEPADDECARKSAKELYEKGFTLYIHEDADIDNRFFAKALDYVNKDNNCLLVYCDEDVRIKGKRRDPFFKPDFSPDTLRSFFYIGGALMLRDSEPGRAAAEDEWTGDFWHVETEEELKLHARTILDAYYMDRKHFSACHISGALLHRKSLSYYTYENSEQHGEDKPVSVSAVILSKDNRKMLLDCIKSLMDNADISMEYIVVDNGSSEAVREKLTAELHSLGVKYIYSPMEFKYSALCNIGARAAEGDYILLLNDDILLPASTKNFPSGLVSLDNDGVGAIGAKLLYPESERGSDCIQHAGITQLKVGPSHKMCTLSDSQVYERGRNRGVWNVLAVTGACLLVKREKFFAVNGFDETLHVAYTDVDLCLDMYEKGWMSAVNNELTLVHCESVSRGRDDKSDERALRLKAEREYFYRKHPWLLEQGDPFYNKCLTATRLDYQPDYTLPWESTDTVTAMAEAGISFKQMVSGKLLCSIDRVDYIASSFEGEKPVYEIEGWVILHGRSQLGCDPVVITINAEGKKTVYQGQHKLREELEAVFPGEKHTLMSGFVCRIAADELKADGRLRLAIGVLRTGLIKDKVCYYCVTEKEIEDYGK